MKLLQQRTFDVNIQFTSDTGDGMNRIPFRKSRRWRGYIEQHGKGQVPFSSMVQRLVPFEVRGS